MRRIVMEGAKYAINRGVTMLSQIDRFRIFAQESFTCKKCGVCCIDSDPIVVYEADVIDLMKFFKLPKSKIIKKYLLPHGESMGKSVYKFKHTTPCKFLDSATRKCKIYEARPIACKIYPFLSSEGIENKTCGYTDCPGSVEFVNFSNQDRETQSMLTAFTLLPEDMQERLDKGIAEKMRSYFKGEI